jgi:WD40 repeat protein
MGVKSMCRLLPRLCPLALVILYCASLFAEVSQKRYSLNEVVDVRANMVVENGEQNAIRAFDISPDGSLLAILSGDRTASGGTELKSVLFSLAERKIVLRTSLGDDYPEIGGYIPHILFSPDQKYIVVQTTRTVKVLSVDSLKVVREIRTPEAPFNVPLDISLSSATDLVAITYGAGRPYTFAVQKVEAYIQFVHLSSGEIETSWRSDDKIQTLSPDGSFAALSDWSAPQTSGVLKLKITNVQKAAIATVVDPGYFFRSSTSSYPGRCIGSFITNLKIVLSPDATRDERGDGANGKLKLVNWKSKTVEREISVKGLSPTGELTAAKDGKSFVVVSWFLSSNVAHHDVALPSGSSPSAYLFNDQGRIVAVVEHLDAKGLSINGVVDVLRPRLSADGSRLALAQGGGIKVFELH